MSAVRTRKKYLKLRDGKSINERSDTMRVAFVRSGVAGRRLVSYFPASKTGNVSQIVVVRFVSKSDSESAGASSP